MSIFVESLLFGYVQSCVWMLCMHTLCKKICPLLCGLVDVRANSRRVSCVNSRTYAHPFIRIYTHSDRWKHCASAAAALWIGRFADAVRAVAPPTAQNCNTATYVFYSFILCGKCSKMYIIQNISSIQHHSPDPIKHILENINGGIWVYGHVHYYTPLMRARTEHPHTTKRTKHANWSDLICS